MGVRNIVNLKALSCAIESHNQKKYGNKLYVKYSEKVTGAIDSISGISREQFSLLLNIERKISNDDIKGIKLEKFIEDAFIKEKEIKMNKTDSLLAKTEEKTKNKPLANLICDFYNYNKEIIRLVNKAEKYTKKMFDEVEQNKIDSYPEVYKKYCLIKEKQKTMKMQINSVKSLISRIFPEG